MAPPPSVSIQSSYKIIVAMTQMGIGYMVSNQLNKIWLVDNFKLNLKLIENWAANGFITPYQYSEYLRLGDIITTFPITQYQ